jgi:hypothetical protein
MIMRKNIKYLLVLLLPLFSCGYNITTVEMIEQKKGLLEELKYRINTTAGSLELDYKTKQIIDLHGEIIGIGSSFNSFYGHGDFTNLYETCYYSSSEKRIIVYFYLYKYEIKTIENINALLLVEPFENFNGFYTEYFIFEDNLYQAVSLKPEIEIGEYVEEFDFNKIKKLNISQYKLIRPYGESDKLIEKEKNDNGIHSFYLNYIFPEELDPRYIKLSLL